MTSREFKKKLRNVSRDGVQSDSDGRQSSTEPPVTNRDVAAAGDSAVQSPGLLSKQYVHSDVIICTQVQN